MQKKAKRAVTTLLAAILLLVSIPAQAATKTEVPFTKVMFPSAAVVYQGDAKTLTVTSNPNNATYKMGIVFTVEDESIAQVTKRGTGDYNKSSNAITIKAKKVGETSVRAVITTYDSAGKQIKKYAGRTKVTVKPKKTVTSLKLNRTSATINMGSRLELKAIYTPADAYVGSGITWKSSDETVVKVNRNGVVTPWGPGTATITTTAGNKKATCKITVKAPITSLKANKTAVTVVEGGGIGITLTYAPGNTTDSKKAIWTTSNAKVATVKQGWITGVSKGTCTVTGKMGTKTVKIKVTVKYVAPTFVNTSEIMARTNSYRKAAGIRALKRDAKLDKIAQTRAKEIVVKFSHTRPNGTSCLSLIPGNVYKGENIAMGYATCAAATTSWYNSAGHRANMLNKNYTKIGIAGYKYKNTMYWVQVFSS